MIDEFIMLGWGVICENLEWVIELGFEVYECNIVGLCCCCVWLCLEDEEKLVEIGVLV